MATVLTITLKRSHSGHPEKQLRTLRALGLRKINSTITIPDSVAVRGQLAKIGHMVQVTESEG